jgi:DNA-binding transcriptional LysR family regulator
MKLNSLDLNLLLVFDALIRKGSVSGAAEEVGLTQPSMSNALSRLRSYFNDPLFVRSQGSMQPTPLAETLVLPVQRALAELQEVLHGTRSFDPGRSHRVFTVCMSEIAQRVFLPRLLAHFEIVASHIQVQTLDLSPQRTSSALASGELDLAIGYFADLGDHFYNQRIFKERYVALLRQGHPALQIKAKLAYLSEAAYLQATHISYLPAAASHSLLDTLLDKQFSALGAKRRVGLRVAHSMGMSSIVESTDLMATIPSRLAQSFSDQKNLVAVDLPFEIPSITIAQHWHSRYHHDLANQWLRAQIQTLFQA